jgi:hypothetical protein
MCLVRCHPAASLLSSPRTGDVSGSISSQDPSTFLESCQKVAMECIFREPNRQVNYCLLLNVLYELSNGNLGFVVGHQLLYLVGEG